MAKNILIYGEIGWNVTSQEVAQTLIDSEEEPISVRINSTGGDVFEAYAIYNALNSYKGDVQVYIDGIAASAASIVALCGGNKPKMPKNAMMMFHSASTCTGGNKKKMEEQAMILDSIDTALATIVSDKCGKSVEEVKNAYFDGADHWLTADECASLGIAEIYEPTAEDMTECKFVAMVDYKAEVEKKKQVEEVEKYFDCPIAEVINKATATSDYIASLISDKEQMECRIAELQSYEQELTDIKNKLREEQEKRDEQIILDAVREGKISNDIADDYRSLMKSDRNMALRLLGNIKIQPQRKVEDFLNVSRETSESVWEREINKIRNKK